MQQVLDGSDLMNRRVQITSTFNKHYKDVSNKSSSYISWSDARIRGWLREHGIPVESSTQRDDLLTKMRTHCEW